MYCGGDNTEDCCVQFSAGSWDISHTLSARRWHSAWHSYPGGVLLLGGEPDQHNTTELVSPSNSSTSEHWGLSYDSRSLQK